MAPAASHTVEIDPLDLDHSDLRNVPLPGDLTVDEPDVQHTEQTVRRKFRSNYSQLAYDDEEEELNLNMLKSVTKAASFVSDLRVSSARHASMPAYSFVHPAGHRLCLTGGCHLPTQHPRGNCSAHSLARACTARVPMLQWLPHYSYSLLRADLAAGLTVGVVIIPQGMAYAMLAELPAIYGLYSSLVPLPIYAMMCSSRHMSVGPFALVSLLVADSVIEAGYEPEHVAYIPAVMLLSLMIGILHCTMAWLHLGVIVRLISDSVLAGFTSAAAVLISASQLKHLFGMDSMPVRAYPSLPADVTLPAARLPLARLSGMDRRRPGRHVRCPARPSPAAGLGCRTPYT